MAEESDATIIQPVTEANPAQERITQLSEKVKTTAEERDTAKAATAEAERRAAFAEGFVDIVTTQPAAKDFKDDIRKKVVENGYSVADATYAVLGAAGKLGGNAPAPTPQVAGGSATTTITQQDSKSPSQMSQAERRSQLEKDLLWN